MNNDVNELTRSIVLGRPKGVSHLRLMSMRTIVGREMSAITTSPTSRLLSRPRSPYHYQQHPLTTSSTTSFANRLLIPIQPMIDQALLSDARSIDSSSMQSPACRRATSPRAWPVSLPIATTRGLHIAAHRPIAGELYAIARRATRVVKERGRYRYLGARTPVSLV